MRFHDQTEQLEPSLADCAATLQPWILEASNPYAHWYFGDEQAASSFIGSWLLRASSELYLGRAVLMFDNQHEPIIGCMIGMAGSQLASCRTADFAVLCEALQARPDMEQMIEQMIRVSRELFPEVAADTFYISRVAIAPDRRGRGLGKALLSHSIDLQRARGFRRFGLEVSADNAIAIRLCASLGLRVVRGARSADAELEYWSMALKLP